MKNSTIDKNETIEKDVELLINKADIIIENTIAKINNELINLYWSIGKIVYDYQSENKTNYGSSVINRFCGELYRKYGKNFNQRNIYHAIRFYETFPILNMCSKFNNLSWSHIREIIKFKDREIRDYYLNEVENKKLTIEELLFTIKSKAFERTISNQRESKHNNIEKALRDPIILNIPNKKRTERELEDEIIENISNFKKEIGNIVTFFERQYKININGLMHKVDLVFLDYETNTFILVDLKINKVTNHDIMQMQLYIEYFSKELKNNHTNVIGLILCETKDLRLIENKNIYQIKYLNEIPKDKELLKIINDNKIILLKTENLKLEGVSNE